MRYKIDTNPLLEEMRAAYRKSPMYARVNGLETEQAPAESGGTPELARDALEDELVDRGNP